MAAELRWILLALSLLLLTGIWWWGRRRSLQAPGNAALREMSPTSAALRSDAMRSDSLRSETPADNAHFASETEVAADAEAEAEAEGPAPQGRGWGVPPFEPLSIRTQDYDRVPILDGPMMVDADLVPARASAPAHAPAPAHASTAAASPKPASTLPAGRVPTLLESADRSSAAPAQTANA